MARDGKEILELGLGVGRKKCWVPVSRFETVFGVTFVLISEDHDLAAELVSESQRNEVERQTKNPQRIGSVFTGSYALNPVNEESIPIYISFELKGEETKLGVPAHNQEDFEFSKKHGVRIKQVIRGLISSAHAYTGNGTLINSGPFSGMHSERALSAIAKWLIAKKFARKRN